MCDVQVAARGPGILILAVLLFTNRKAAGNTPYLESLELTEMRKWKMPKSKQKPECVEAELLLISNTPKQTYLKCHTVFLSTAEGINIHVYFFFVCILLRTRN